jgi:pilus assembly protein Flp/PilA
MIQQAQFFVAWMQTKFGVDLTTERQEGQGLVEYALILILVSLVVIAGLTLLGTNLLAKFNAIAAKVA